MMAIQIDNRTIYFSTPIESIDSPLSQVVDSYVTLFNCEGARQIETGNYDCRKTSVTTHWAITVIKIISYVATVGILPILALLVKYIIRSSHEFRWVAEVVALPKDVPIELVVNQKVKDQTTIAKTETVAEIITPREVVLKKEPVLLKAVEAAEKLVATPSIALPLPVKVVEKSAQEIREELYKDRLLNELLPGIKEEQLPLNLTSHNPKTKQIEWEVTYNAISPQVYGRAFYESLGVHIVGPIDPIPEYLFEKRYLPTHTLEVAADSKLSLTSDGKLTKDAALYAPKGHRHFRPTVRSRALEFPNTKDNRAFLKDLLGKEPTYLKQSPLERGCPFISFPRLKIEVDAGSGLQSVGGVLIEGPGSSGESGKKTVEFENTPHNWLILAAPDLDNPNRTKYLNENAKPVGIEYVWDPIKLIWDTPPPSEWKSPATNLVALYATYLQSEAEALELGQCPLTFQQDSIHRILTQIRGNADLYPKQFSRTATPLTASRGATYKAGTYVHPLAVAPAAPARVLLYCRYDNDDVGLAAAVGPAGSP